MLQSCWVKSCAKRQNMFFWIKKKKHFSFFVIVYYNAFPASDFHLLKVKNERNEKKNNKNKNFF
jgi:uncharacterized protein YcgL (UPF0745 family)